MLFPLTGILEPMANVNAQGYEPTHVYVWDFGVSHAHLGKYATVYRNDFETELIKLNRFTVLERRRYDRIMAHQDMENNISDIRKLSPNSRDSLKANKADAVFFGELIYHDESGKYQVKVTFQHLNGNILKQGDILIDKAKIDDIELSKVFMRKLLGDLYAGEVLAARKKQYDHVSSLLRSYLASIKDVSIAFGSIADFAFKDEKYYKELEQTVYNYNDLWRNLDSNRGKYLTDFESVWGPPYARRFESIYSEIMDNIHVTEILPLNKVREDIWNYRERALKKKEKERMKKKIMENVDDMVDDLQEETIEIKTRINFFLDDLKREM